MITKQLLRHMTGQGELRPIVGQTFMFCNNSDFAKSYELYDMIDESSFHMAKIAMTESSKA